MWWVVYTAWIQNLLMLILSRFWPFAILLFADDFFFFCMLVVSDQWGQCIDANVMRDCCKTWLQRPRSACSICKRLVYNITIQFNHGTYWPRTRRLFGVWFGNLQPSSFQHIQSWNLYWPLQRKPHKLFLCHQSFPPAVNSSSSFTCLDSTIQQQLPSFPFEHEWWKQQRARNAGSCSSNPASVLLQLLPQEVLQLSGSWRPPKCT